MAGITLENDRITYYGNPAGYRQKDTAVVDCIFRCDELTAFLDSRWLTPKWTEGVMERLLAGAHMGGENAPPLKEIRIWQMKDTVDPRMKFISLAELRERFGEPLGENYRAVYDGQLGTNDLDAIFERCNLDHPPGYTGYSLSISDIVELYDESGSAYHYVDRFGFQQIPFDTPEQDMGLTMSQSL